MKDLIRAAAIALALLTAPALAVPAGAQWMGELSSTVLSPLPPHPAIDVVIYDDTDQNLAFRKTFLDALARAGFQVAEDAPGESAGAQMPSRRAASLLLLPVRSRASRIASAPRRSACFV